MTSTVLVCAELSLLAYNENSKLQPYADCPPPVSCAAGEAGAHVWDVRALALPSGVTTVVAFQGTDSLGDWVDNLDLKLVELGLDRVGRVHRGFYSQYRQLAPLLQPAIAACGGGSTGGVCFTGHSLGAALATIASVGQGRALDEPPLCITFGSPRVGDADFADAFADRVRRTSLRVTHASDPVCLVPLAPYRHVRGRALYVQPEGGRPSGWSLKHHEMSQYVAAVRRHRGGRAAAQARAPLRLLAAT